MQQNDFDFDVIDADSIGQGDGPADTALVGNRNIGNIQTAERHLVGRNGNVAPAFGDAHGGIGINETKAEIVADMHAAAIPVACAIE